MMSNRFSRQSFLGSGAETRLSRCTCGVVGLGGGGSHVIQQLAHVGFQRYVLYDQDMVEDTNLNRLVGARSADALAQTPKLHIAKTMIYGLQSNASVRGFACKWQDNPESLRECQVVFGCVDTYKCRQEIEVACRRYLMHYIDIGVDVHGADKPQMGGQVILSSPGNPCMRCLGFLTDEKLAEEASRYGNAGPRPQVVWANGVLASTAVGLAVEIVTNWARRTPYYAYYVYDGNLGTLAESLTIRNVALTGCPHFPNSAVGDPVLLEW